MKGKKNIQPAEVLRRLALRAFAVTALIAATVALWSCDNDVLPPLPDTPESEQVVYLTLKVDINEGAPATPQSRADGSYYYEEPTRENERMHDLFVVILNAENNTVESHRFVRFDESAVISTDNLIFKLTTGDKRVILVANSSSVPAEIVSILETPAGEVFPEAELNAATMTRYYTQPFFTSNQNIPMAETFDISLQPDNTNGTPSYYFTRVFVTRIAVKYTFMCPDEVSGITVSLPSVATVQNFMPVGVDYFPGKYLPGETINGITGRNITAFTPVSQPTLRDFRAKLTGRRRVNALAADGTPTDKFTYRYDPIYMMETPGTNFYLSALFDEGAKDALGNDVSGTWFENKPLTNLPLLPRNTHVIINLSGTAGLNCSVDLVPYRGCVLQPYFGVPRN